jgi:multiple sugar transport system substrate-binding protein
MGKGTDMNTNRRSMLRAGLAASALIGAGAPRGAQAQAIRRVAPVSMVINQSPWFAGFRRIVEDYMRESGNRIEFDVNPYAGALEKVRNSLRATSGQFDLLAIDNNWMVEMFAAGYLAPIDDVEPGFRLEPEVNTYDSTIFWNAERRTFDAASGRMMGVPINGNVEMLFYRADLYQEKRLTVPRTWDELRANAIALNDPPRVYGMVHRDDRTSTTADFANYLFSFGGAFFADPAGGDLTVTINSPVAKRALDFYLDLGRVGGHPSPGAVSQGQLIQLLLTGRAAHVIAIAGAWAQVDNPQGSAVVGKVNAALVPRASDGRHVARAGHWIGAIARNVPREKQLAALEFLKWFIAFDRQVKYTEYGSIPVRTDLGRANLAALPQARFLPALAESSRVARMVYTVPEAAQLFAITDLRLNEAANGQRTAVQALNMAAAEMHAVMQRAGYRTGRLPDLT